MINNYDKLNDYYLQKYPAFLEISRLFLTNSRLKDFAYQRLYIGGTHFILFTNKEYSSCFFDTVHELSPNFLEAIEASNFATPYFHIWPQIPIDQVLLDLLRYNIWNGLTVYIKHERYIDCYYFSGNKESENLASYYMNNKERILDFIYYFNKSSKEFIATDKNVLGQHTGSCILKAISSPLVRNDYRLASASLNKPAGYNEIRLTKQELKCLEELAQGYSVKFIANKLALSPRTVEHHVVNVKHKTNCYYKDDLVQWFHASKSTLSTG